MFQNDVVERAPMLNICAFFVGTRETENDWSIHRNEQCARYGQTTIEHDLNVWNVLSASHAFWSCFDERYWITMHHIYIEDCRTTDVCALDQCCLPLHPVWSPIALLILSSISIVQGSTICVLLILHRIFRFSWCIIPCNASRIFVLSKQWSNLFD